MLTDQAEAVGTSLQTSLALKVPPCSSPFCLQPLSSRRVGDGAKLHVLLAGAASRAEMPFSSYLKRAEVLAGLAISLEQMQSWELRGEHPVRTSFASSLADSRANWALGPIPEIVLG